MGKLQVPGGLSGRIYNVTIEGDTPTDAEVARASALINEREQQFAAEYEQQFGRPLAVDDGTALGRGFDVGKTSAYSALGTAARDLGEATGFDWLQNLGMGMEGSARAEQLREAVQMPAPTRLEDITGLGSGLTFLGEVAGQSLPEMGATLGATALGTLAGGPAGGFAAGTATATPFFYGRNIQRQEQQIAEGALPEKDRLDAFLAAGGSAVLNTIGDKLLLTGRLFGLSIPRSRNLFVRSAQFAGAGAAAEVPTEITQQILERAQAGLPLDDDEAIKEYIEVGVAAGLLGGAIGGATGPFRAPTAEETPPGARPPAATPPATLQDVDANLPTLQEGQEQGALFPDMPEQRAPEPMLLTPEQRIRPGEQLELPIQQPRVLQPSERVDAQREMELYLPRGVQPSLFGANPPAGRPALEVMDELQVAPQAPIRKRLAAALDTDNRFLEELQRYARTPGVKKATRSAIDSYLNTRTAREAPVAKTPVQPEPTAGAQPATEAQDARPGTQATAGTGTDVPSPTRRMGVSGVRPSARPSAPGVGAPDVGAVGAGRPDTPAAAATAAKQPSAVTPPAAPTPAAPTPAAPAAPAGRRFTGPITDSEYRALSDADKDTYLDEVGLPPPPASLAGTVTPPAAPAAPAVPPTAPSSGLSIKGIDDAISNGVASLTVEENGKRVPFNKFALSVEGDKAEVGFVERDKSARKGIGYDSYVKLGTELAARGVTLQASSTRQAPGQELWKKLEKNGYAKLNPATKKLEFVAPQAEPALATEQTAPNLRRPVVPEPTLRRPEGATITATGQLIPAGLRPVQGRVLEQQAAAAREPIARQLNVKAELEATAAQLKELLASRRKLTERAKTEGVKRGALESKLRKQLNQTNTRLYNVTSYLRSEAGRQQAATENQTNAVNMMEGAENDFLRKQLRDWYEINAPQDVQAYDADIRGETSFVAGAANTERRAQLKARFEQQAAARDPSTVQDKRKLLELLSMSKQQLKNDKKARAAYTYFSKTRDMADAVDNIAFDLTDPDVPKRRIGAPKLGVKLETYWQGTGKDMATAASEWIEANLSEDVTAYMDEQVGAYLVDNGRTLSAQLDREQMTRIERDKAETEYLKKYTTAEAALRDTAAFEGTTPEAMTREELLALDRERVGTDLDFDPRDIGVDFGDAILRNKRRSIAYGLEAPMHPAIIKAMRSNNLRRVLEGIAATNVDPYIQNLAAALLKVVGNTKIYTTYNSPRVRELLTDQKSGEVFAGSYVLMDKADYDRIVGETSETYAQQLQDSILIDEARGLNVHTILHEMVHAATSRELRNNPNGPFAKRMQKLLEDAKRAVGTEFELRGEPLPYGFENIAEFVAEAMSNQEFQQILDRIYPNTTKASALTQFARNLINFVRTRILGRPAKTYDVDRGPSVFDEVDYLTQSVFSQAPEFAAKVSLFGDAMSPLRAADAFGTMGKRVKGFGPLDKTKWDAFMADGMVPNAYRTALANLFMPVRNLTESAKKFFPNADDVYQHITNQRELEERLNNMVSGSLDKTSSFLDAHPQLEGLFHSFRTRASRYEIDVRRPRSFYDKYVLSYYTLDKDGKPADRKFESFDTVEARTDRIAQLNAAEAAGAQHTKARKVNDPDPETLATYDNLRRDYDKLVKDGGEAFKSEYNRMLGIPEALQKEAAAAVKDRLDAMLPGDENAASRNIILRGLYNKIFAEKGLVAYQSLLRSGDFKVTYTGINPDTNTTEIFSHGFKTSGEAIRAVELLKALPPEYNVNDIEVVRRGPSDRFNIRQVPPTFVSDVTRLVGKAMQDTPNGAALAAQLNEQIVELALNALPETSIFQSYRARKGVSGFKGDLSPLKAAMEEINPEQSETLDDPKETRVLTQDKMQSLARQVASIRQQAGSTRVAADLRAQYEALLTAGALTDREFSEARAYYDALQTALNNPAVRRSNLIANVNTGAFVATLWGNVSSVVMNIMSIPTVVYPRLAAQYGPVKAAKMIHQSLRLLMSSGRTRLEPIITETGQVGAEAIDAGFFGISLKNRSFGAVDLTKAYTAEGNRENVLKYLVDEGTRRHMFVDSVLYDYLEMNKTGLNQFASKILHAGAAPMHHSERYMRESTMLTNYLLELDRLAAKSGTDVLTEEQMKAAAKTAVYETERMTGTVPAAGAPNWALKGIMPAVFMFKRYPLAIVNMLVGDAKRAFPSKRSLIEKFGEGTPEFENAMENRKIARLQLAGVLGSIGLWAGAAGMPLYGAIADLFDAFFTDEDEENFDTLTRRAIGEFGYKGLGNYLFGIEMSSRIGLNGIFYREPLRADDQPPLWNVIEGIGGPAVSLAHGWTTRSADLFDQGEYYRALESALPASVRNVMRSYRFLTTGGADSLRDDIISDIGPGQALAQALGFAPSTYVRQLELNSAAKTIDSGINTRRTRLLRRLNIARRQGDSDEIRVVMRDIQRFNQDHPSNPITQDTISRSAKTFERTTERVIHGIVYTDNNRPALKELFDLMDRPSTFWQ